MTIATVTDASDPRLAAYRDLRDPTLRTRERCFVAESTEVIRSVLAAPRYRVRSLLLTPSAHARLAPFLNETSVEVFIASRDLLTAITGVQLHRGGLALVERGIEPTLDDVLARRPCHVVLLDDVTNPDNVGSIFRTARAFGIDALVLSPGCADPLYRKTVRVSLGASVLVPWARDPTWPASLERLRADGMAVVALTAAPEAVDLEAFVARGRPPRVALVLGNEGSGLSPAVQGHTDIAVTVRMAVGVDSLNVAAAAAIALYRLAG